jgi:hypothetical protein
MVSHLLGGWKNNLWGYFPRHEMEYRHHIEPPEFEGKYVQNRQIPEGDVR